MGLNHRSCWPAYLAIWECALGDSGSYLGFSWLYKPLCGRYQWAVVRQRKGIWMESWGPYCLRHFCILQIFGEPESVPQVEAQGQLNGPFSCTDWGYVSVCCLCSGVCVVPTWNFLSDCYHHRGPRSSSPSGHPEPGNQGTLVRLQEMVLVGHACSLSNAREEAGYGAHLQL